MAARLDDPLGGAQHDVGIDVPLCCDQRLDLGQQFADFGDALLLQDHGLAPRAFEGRQPLLGLGQRRAHRHQQYQCR